jgi:hypothetical protein
MKNKRKLYQQFDMDMEYNFTNIKMVNILLNMMEIGILIKKKEKEKQIIQMNHIMMVNLIMIYMMVMVNYFGNKDMFILVNGHKEEWMAKVNLDIMMVMF